MIKQPIDCTAPQMNNVAALAIPVRVIVAIEQALQYAMEHEAEFLAQYKCNNCYQQVKEVHGLFHQIITTNETETKLRTGGGGVVN